MNQTAKTIFSARWNLAKIELKKLATGFLLGLGGAILTYLQVNFITDIKGVLDVSLKPEYIPLALGVITAFNSSVINVLRKYATATTYIDKQ